jgi:hypothetical protein
VSGATRWQVGRDVGLFILALVAFVLVTYEFAFVHEPQLLTTLLVYRIDRVFLAALYQPWRRTGGSKASAYQAALDRPSVTATMHPWATAASREPSVPRMFGHPRRGPVPEVGRGCVEAGHRPEDPTGPSEFVELHRRTHLVPAYLSRSHAQQPNLVDKSWMDDLVERLC